MAHGTKKGLRPLFCLAKGRDPIAHGRRWRLRNMKTNWYLDEL